MPVGVSVNTCPLHGIQHIGAANRNLAASFASIAVAILGSAVSIDHQLASFRAKAALRLEGS